MARVYRDLCLLAWARLVEYDENDEPIEYDSFRCVVLSNSGWWEGHEIDDSPLSDLIGELDEEDVFSTHDLGKLYVPFRNYEGKYRVIPAILLYTCKADEISVKAIHPLCKEEIQDAIDILLMKRMSSQPLT